MVSKKTRKKMSLSAKKRIKNFPHTIPNNVGRKHSNEWNKKNSFAKIGIFVGAKSPNWRGGITSENHRIRMSTEMKNWKKEILKRDNYTCQWCTQRGVRLIADHIKMFAFYPKLRFELSNGQTLCESCHSWKTRMDNHIYFGKVPELNYI